MMENKSEREISNLLPELALYICEYIDDRDILNAVEAIPTWNWIASSTWLRVHLSRRISQLSWIDRYIYRRLFPQPSPHFFRDPRGALEYRLKQEEFYTNKYYIPQDRPNIRDIRFLVFPPSDPDLKLDFNQVKIHFDNTRTPVLHRITSEDIDRGTENNAALPCDFALFFADMSEICKEDLQLMVDSLCPHQTFAIIVLKDVKTDRRSDFQCLLDFLNHLGGLDKSPLANSLFHWRLWCVHHDSEKNVDMRELLTWLVNTSLWRRKQSGRWDNEETSTD